MSFKLLMVLETEMSLFTQYFWDILECSHELPHRITSFYTHAREHTQIYVPKLGQEWCSICTGPPLRNLIREKSFQKWLRLSKGFSNMHVMLHKLGIHIWSIFFSILVCSCWCIWQRPAWQTEHIWMENWQFSKPTRGHFWLQLEMCSLNCT